MPQSTRPAFATYGWTDLDPVPGRYKTGQGPDGHRPATRQEIVTADCPGTHKWGSRVG
jgi:hypothetical protein